MSTADWRLKIADLGIVDFRLRLPTVDCALNPQPAISLDNRQPLKSAITILQSAIDWLG
jgi:hypothetical protein